MTDKLSHLNEAGEARMVDVSAKAVTTRLATASATIRMKPETHDKILAGDTPKGDVLGTARIAAIMAVKKTSDTIPMCHPLAISGVEVAFDTSIEADATGRAGIMVTVAVKITGKTGVEMEALHGASVAALTIYDMAKAVEKSMEIVSIRLLSKSGGKSGDYCSE
ncbi:MAG: cyclic pyranopterin monophosphate synthase MoaC [Planctomycetes bacterium]|nr:cyclic pyranopterin monophosphate synthase MoaC [Planctomycetota bacterium]